MIFVKVFFNTSYYTFITCIVAIEIMQILQVIKYDVLTFGSSKLLKKPNFALCNNRRVEEFILF